MKIYVHLYALEKELENLIYENVYRVSFQIDCS